VRSLAWLKFGSLIRAEPKSLAQGRNRTSRDRFLTKLHSGKTLLRKSAKINRRPFGATPAHQPERPSRGRAATIRRRPQWVTPRRLKYWLG